MSRFGPVDPFYPAIGQGMIDERIERVARVYADRYRRVMADRPLRPPIVDHDPGDEDRS